ncbi:zinc finger protein 862-like [Lytechinus pictus]|uniref:zinc finger protein 862-like n=1 Tax=Lytechinus pictus TaxID=7653 RepID=UPI0030B9C220
MENAIEKKEPIVESILKMDSQLHNRMIKLFDISYHLVKHDLPFAYFPSLISLEKRHGVDLGNTYANPIQAQVFTGFLAEDVRFKGDEDIRKARYISVLIDGSTDKSTIENEVLYIKYLQDEMPCMKFLGISDVENATAAGIVTCIEEVFTTHDIMDWKTELVGCGADGASTNFGIRGGVISKLTQDIPWLLGIHCVAHRLELAAKDAYKNSYFSSEINSVLTSYASFYRRSPKRLRELSDMADLLEEKIHRPTRVDGTRWLDHRRRALSAFEKNYPSVVAHMNEIGSGERSDVKGEDVSKARGMVKKITSLKFLLHMALYIDKKKIAMAFFRCLPNNFFFNKIIYPSSRVINLYLDDATLAYLGFLDIQVGCQNIEFLHICSKIVLKC